MIRTPLQPLLLSALRCTAAFALGLAFSFTSGCSALKNASPSNGPAVLPTTPEAAAVANSQSNEPTYDNRDEDRTLKCEQLVRNPPGIEEIRRTPSLGIESREIRVERTVDSYRWVVYRSRGSAPNGWHTQNHLDKLNFNPPLQFLLPDEKPEYLAYAPSLPETPQDSEQQMSIADNFGARVGTFEWNGKHYTYTVSKELPCFPQPEE